MDYYVSKYSSSQIKKAGKKLVKGDDPDAFTIMDAWRLSHYYPLNVFYVTLQRKVAKIDKNGFVAQRIKRAPSIINKLQRFEQMSLASMQDIAGCRAVVSKFDDVYKLRKAYLESRLRHELVNEKDYIDVPKDDGYRGIHLVYKCVFDRKSTSVYNGTKVEIQIRTKRQHAWATAVETVDAFEGTQLKSGNQAGKWYKFFRLMSDAIEANERKVKLKNEADLYTKILLYNETMQIEKRLEGYAVGLQFSEERSSPQDGYNLFELNTKENKLQLARFKKSEALLANEYYATLEQQSSKDPNIYIALTSVSDLKKLKQAYPNYFADTNLFLEEIALIKKKMNKLTK